MTWSVYPKTRKHPYLQVGHLSILGNGCHFKPVKSKPKVSMNHVLLCLKLQNFDSEVIYLTQCIFEVTDTTQDSLSCGMELFVL